MILEFMRKEKAEKAAQRCTEVFNNPCMMKAKKEQMDRESRIAEIYQNPKPRKFERHNVSPEHVAVQIKSWD